MVSADIFRPAKVFPATPATSALSDVVEVGITVVILTRDEAMHIVRCIERIRPIARRIIVIDSFSTDGTQEIARNHGAEVYERKFTYHADQLRWGLAEADVTRGWILRLDADEYLQQSLSDEIRERLHSLPPDVSAIEFKLRVVFQQRWIRWGGYYETILLRLWRADAAGVEDKLMDERIALWSGRSVRFDCGDLVDENLSGIERWTAKHNMYSTRHMMQFIRREYGIGPDGYDGQLSRQARRKRFLRDGVYAAMPLYLRSVLYFFYRYVLRLGILDGKEGFVWHVLQGFWHMLLIDVKIDEARRFIAINGVDAFDRELHARHGLRLHAAEPSEQAN